MTWKKAGFFVPGEVILAADQNPQNKEIHHPVWFAGSLTKTDTAPRRLSGTRRQYVCLPCFALFFACSARLCCCAVDVRLRKEREERAENVTYSAGRARRRRGGGETVRCTTIQWAARVSWWIFTAAYQNTVKPFGQKGESSEWLCTLENHLHPRGKRDCLILEKLLEEGRYICHNCLNGPPGWNKQYNELARTESVF